MTDTKAVYVTMENEQETLVYNSKLMKYNKKYFVTWCGTKFMLVKKNDIVELNELEEIKKQQPINRH